MNKANRAAFFSANVHQYLPHLPWSQHSAYYRLYRRYHTPRAIPSNSPGRLMGSLPSKPGIIAAFHLGDHTLLPVCLAISGIAFDLLIDRQTYQRYAPVLEAAGARYGGGVGKGYRFLFSDDRRLFFQIREAVGQGRHILIFVDGNGGEPAPPGGGVSLLPVPFFAGTLWVKKGVATLSRLLSVPVYPIVSRWAKGMPHFEPAPEILPDRSIDRERDASRMLGSLFGLLQRHLARSPMRWECWAYLHQNGMLRMEAANPVAARQPDTSAAQMARLEVNGQVYWLDKENYLLFIPSKIT